MVRLALERSGDSEESRLVCPAILSNHWQGCDKVAGMIGRQQGCWEVEGTEEVATTAKQNITYSIRTGVMGNL